MCDIVGYLQKHTSSTRRWPGSAGDVVFDFGAEFIRSASLQVLSRLGQYNEASKMCRLVQVNTAKCSLEDTQYNLTSAALATLPSIHD